MRTVSQHKAINEKQHKCNACLRKFPKGTEMKVLNIVVYFNMHTFRICPTCTELTENYMYYFADDYGILEQGCVKEACNGEMTPEQLFEQLKNEPK